MVGRLIVNRMETNQHESNKKAVSPVRSIQHVSHQHTGDIGKSLQEEYLLYNRYKGCERVTQSCGRAQMRLRRSREENLSWFPEAWAHFSLVLLNQVKQLALASTWVWFWTESILGLFEKTTFVDSQMSSTPPEHILFGLYPCSPMGPLLGPQVPMGTFLGIWVPIGSPFYVLGPLFLYFRTQNNSCPYHL